MSDVGPYCYKRMRVKITYNGVIYILGVVDVSEMELLREGGVESKYGKNSDNVLHGGDSSRRHRVGMKRMRFRLRRWFKTDTGKTDLLFFLHDNSLSFDLEEYVPQTVIVGPEWSGVKITNCVSYSYHQVGGTANDIMVEEIVGEGTTFSEVIVDLSVKIYSDERGYFKRLGEIWFWDPELSNGGSSFYIQGEVWLWEPTGDGGGSYFAR